MPAAIAAPPPKPSTPAPAADKPTQISGPIGNEPSPENYLGDIGSDLADLDAAGGPSPGPVAPKRDPSTGKFQKPQDKQPDKPKETPKEEGQPEVPKDEKQPEKPAEEERPSNMRQLGKKYDELKKERDTVLTPKIQSLEAKTKEYERTIEELRTKQPDVKPLQ